MASTAVRYPTPQRVDGSTQHTSVEVTDPLLCPPRTRLGDSSVPPLYLFVLGGYWRLGALPRRSPCRVRYNTFTAWFHNDAGDCCSSLFSPALVQCEANSGGRSRSQRAVLATSIRCLFSLHQLRRLTWPQRRCVTQRLNASTVPPNTRLLR